jgi:lactate dehydrogenase-like 2-hydroxyacid dehydrogenase
VGGRIGRVGRDHLDVDLLDDRGIRLVPFTALLVVSEAP